MDIRKKFFTKRVVKYWCRLPGDVVESPSQKSLKIRLGMVLGSLIYLGVFCWLQSRGWTR